jgi:hypothetical protein
MRPRSSIRFWPLIGKARPGLTWPDEAQLEKYFLILGKTFSGVEIGQAGAAATAGARQQGTQTST